MNGTYQYTTVPVSADYAQIKSFKSYAGVKPTLKVRINIYDLPVGCTNCSYRLTGYRVIVTCIKHPDHADRSTRFQDTQKVVSSIFCRVPKSDLFIIINRIDVMSDKPSIAFIPLLS